MLPRLTILGPVSVTVAVPFAGLGGLRATWITPEIEELAALTAAMVIVDEVGMAAGAA